MKLSKKEAIAELWRRGELGYKLDSAQKQLYSLFYDKDFKVNTWLLSRRAGKTYALVILALEQCIRQKNSIVKFVAPTKLQINTILRPLVKQILDDCPEELKPEFKAKDFIYYFPNGSEIQLAGTDSGHAEKLRGGDSHISIVDEAGSCSDLENLVKSILLPTTLTTKGKIILASTPPKEADHDFIKFIEDAEMRGSLVRKTIDDNPRLSPEQREELIREVGGRNTEACRRELYCELVKDSTTSVIPEFTAELAKEIVKEWPKPPFFDCYEAMDIGFKDLTVIIFAYFDFRANKIIIEDELVITGENLHLPKLVEQIKEKENALWFNIYTNEQRKPYLRVSDINYIVQNELAKHSNGSINFISARKDDNEAALNNLRVMLANKQIIIHPRCVTLIRHLKNVKWASLNNKSTFARSPDDGHYDAVDAIKYLVRHIAFTKNPYPVGYNLDLRQQDAFIYNPSGVNTTINTYRKIFNIKRK